MNTDERLADMERRIEKLCKDCRFFGSGYGNKCKREYRAPAMGEKVTVNCTTARYSEWFCGPTAKHFQQKAVEPGEGYRLLEPGEVVQAGKDEFLYCGDWNEIKEHHGEYAIANDGSSAPHRRKIEQPKFTGPTCEITPELEARFRASCERIVEQEGGCFGVACDNCIGSEEYNEEKHCKENWFKVGESNELCKVAKDNAKHFLDTHPATPKHTTRAEYIASGGDPVVFDEVAIANLDTLEFWQATMMGWHLPEWEGVPKFNAGDKHYRLPADLLENPELEILKCPDFSRDPEYRAIVGFGWFVVQSESADLSACVTGKTHKTKLQAIAYWNRWMRVRFGAEYGRESDE